jgi:CubicO group peptidase (beta-lactamase class C family)
VRSTQNYLHGDAGTFDSVAAASAEAVDLSASPGASVGVLHQGVPMFKAHFGRRGTSDPTSPNDDTLYNFASITKLMTASVVANLVAKGLLGWTSPSASISQNFAARTDELGQKATVTELLANRTDLSAQSTFWDVMNEDIFASRERIPWIACHILALREFRKSFIYSS